MRCNIADTAGAAGQYPAHTMVFIMTLLCISINITSTQTNEQISHRNTWFQCAFKAFRRYKCVWFQLWFVSYSSECLWCAGIIIQSTMKSDTVRAHCFRGAIKNMAISLIVAHNVLWIMSEILVCAQELHPWCKQWCLCEHKLLCLWLYSYISLAGWNFFWNDQQFILTSVIRFSVRAALKDLGEPENERWPWSDCVTSEWALFMRLPACHSHITMNCEQDFADGGLGVTLTLRLLMHGKVRDLQLNTVHQGCN